MRDVISDVLYTQMKGRGCRIIKDDKLREVTPNADTKECYYIVDAVGVTEHEHKIPGGNGPYKKYLTLVQLLERLSHGQVSDENLILLRNYCSSINRRYEDDRLFGKHLDYFISEYGFAPRTLANNINEAIENGTLVEYKGPSEDNTQRLALISILMNNKPARNKLIEMQKGYSVIVEDEDGNVEELDSKHNLNALTNLIQIVRYAFKKNNRLVSLFTGYGQRFSLYCGQNQRELTQEQIDIMKMIADYIVNDGAISAVELNSVNSDLWRKGVKSLTAPVLESEMQSLAKFILRTA